MCTGRAGLPEGRVRFFNGAMQAGSYDVIVMGGGPAGSTAGALLAQAGQKVLILEKERFPRFHIGESLLPYNQELFAELGILEVLEKAGFPRKHGAQFHVGNGSKRLKVQFRSGRFNRHHETFQVERSVFDELLLRNAEKKGAEVREACAVKQALNDRDGVRVAAADEAGGERRFEGGYLIDATGRGNLTGNRDGLREQHPRLRKLSVFSHYSGVRLDAGEAAGDTVIVREEQRWFWLIPVGPDKVSVGCVLDAGAFARMKLKPETALACLIGECPEMRARMREAEALIPVQSTADFSYTNRALTGPRLLRVGDAAGFIDPIFSSGVFLAMTSGRRAAAALDAVIRGRQSERRAFAAYEKQVARSLKFYRTMVEGFYSRSFFELLMEPSNFMSLADAVNAMLAGELSGPWALRWRLWLFLQMAKRQGKRRLAAPISFD